jgi:DNA primase
MPIPDSFLDEIRRRLPLEALVSRRVKLARAGREMKGLCPFHNEKTPSFHCFPDHYHCYGCGAHGDHFRWTMETEKLGFREAVEKLAGEAGLEVPQDSPRQAEAAERAKSLTDIADLVAQEYTRRLFAPEGAAALAYLRGRGLSDQTIRKFRLGWSGEGFRAKLGEITPEQLVAVGAMKANEDGGAPKNLFFGRVMFPITDRRGRVIAFGGRILGDGPAGKTGPKYVNSPETELFKKRRTLYGTDHARDALRGGARLAVVEGYMDVIALAQAGHGAAVAPLGTALTEEHLAELWRLHPEPVLCFDGDAAGARAAERSMVMALPTLAPGFSLGIARLPANEDPDSLVRKGGLESFVDVTAKAQPLSMALFELVAGKRAQTPEKRVAQLRRLEDLAGLIGDGALQSEYRRTFRSEWFAHKGSEKRGNVVHISAHRRSLTHPWIQHRRERYLLCILLDRPGLIAQVCEVIASEEFLHPKTEKIRRYMVAEVEELFGLDAREVIAHLRGAGFKSEVEAVLGDEISALPRPKFKDESSATAMTAWYCEFSRMAGASMKAEIDAARMAFISDANPETERRYSILVAAAKAAAGDSGDPNDEAIA